MDSSRPLVLIADDERNAVILLTRILERDGFAVEEARDGETALRKAEELHPALILMDVQMPKMNGFEVTERLRQNPATERIPVIFVTAAAREPADVAHGFKLGADDYIRKPYNYHELLARAHSKMRARQLEDRLARRTGQLEALVRIGAELNQQIALDGLAEHILQVVSAEIATDHSEIILFDSHEVPALYRTLPGRDSALESAARRLTESERIAEVFASHQPVQWVVDTYGSAEGGDQPEEGLRGMAEIAAPLNHHGALLGIIGLARTSGVDFSESELQMLRSIGEQAALAVRNAQLYGELRSYAQNLEAMVEQRTNELRTAQAQLIRSEKLAALGQLAAGIAHEVNNPLQPILNCLEVAIEDIESGDEVDLEILRVAEIEVQRIKTIVSRLLDFSRPSKTDKSVVDLNALINEVLMLSAKQLERMQIRVVTNLEPVRKIVGNPTQLKQVVLNLMLNASEAMPDGGNLSVELYENYTGVFISVTDDGTGMDQQTISQIFDPFYSTKDDGTGLGLAVSYGIIQGHDGNIRVESEIGQGSRFTIWLPLE